MPSNFSNERTMSKYDREAAKRTHSLPDGAATPRADGLLFFIERMRKWNYIIVLALANRPCRFRALQRALGHITQTTLTDALSNLQRDGLVAER